MEITGTKLNEYLIYCIKHTPLKLRRNLDNKQKKSREDIIKFTNIIDKYLESINSSDKNIKNQFKKLQKYKKTQWEKDQSYKQFFQLIYKQYTYSQGFTIELQKIINNNQQFDQNIINNSQNVNKYKQQQYYQYRIKKVKRPILIFEKLKVTKNDELFQKVNYKNYSVKQVYRRYKKIILNGGMNSELQRRKLSVNECQLEYLKKMEKKKGQEVLCQEVERKEVKEDYKKLFCLCRKKYKDGDEMLACDQCQEWFHYDCLGLIGGEQVANKLEFICPFCLLLDKTHHNNKLHTNSNQSLQSSSNTSLHTQSIILSQQKHFQYDFIYLLVLFYHQQNTKNKSNVNTKKMKTRIQRIRKLFINTNYQPSPSQSSLIPPFFKDQGQKKVKLHYHQQQQQQHSQQLQQQSQHSYSQLSNIHQINIQEVQQQINSINIII